MFKISSAGKKTPEIPRTSQQWQRWIKMPTALKTDYKDLKIHEIWSWQWWRICALVVSLGTSLKLLYARPG